MSQLQTIYKVRQSVSTSGKETCRAPMNIWTLCDAVCMTVPIIIRQAPHTIQDFLPRMSAMYGAKGRAQREPIFFEGRSSARVKYGIITIWITPG